MARRRSWQEGCVGLMLNMSSQRHHLSLGKPQSARCSPCDSPTNNASLLRCGRQRISPVEPPRTASKIIAHPFIKRSLVLVRPNKYLNLTRHDGLAPSSALLGNARIHFSTQNAVVGFFRKPSKHDFGVIRKGSH